MILFKILLRYISLNLKKLLFYEMNGSDHQNINSRWGSVSVTLKRLLMIDPV